MEAVQSIAQETLDFVSKTPDIKPGRVVARLEESEEQIAFPNHLKLFTDALKQMTSSLPERTQVFVNNEAGMLQYKEINFRRSVRQWLDSEVLPVLYEVVGTYRGSDQWDENVPGKYPKPRIAGFE